MKKGEWPTWDQMDVFQDLFFFKITIFLWHYAILIKSKSHLFQYLLYNNYKYYGEVIKIINTKLSITYLNICSYKILLDLNKKSEIIICKCCHFFVNIKFKSCHILVTILWLRWFFLLSSKFCKELYIFLMSGIWFRWN